jgi:TonB family protein
MSGVILALLLAPTTPVETSTLVATVNGWRIYDHKGYCAASTSYESGIFANVAYDLARNDAFLTVTNPAWESVKDDAEYKVTLRFSNGSTYDDAPSTGLKVDAPSGRLTGIVVHLQGDDFLGDFALAGSVGLFIGETRLDVLSLRGTKAVAVRLAQCSASSFRRHPPDPFAEIPATPSPAVATGAEPARAKANLGSLITDDDYPAASIRNHEEGVVGFRLSVGADGRVTDCAITSTSGFPTLDETTCRILRARARFTPARGSNGNAVADTVSARIVWRMQK